MKKKNKNNGVFTSKGFVDGSKDPQLRYATGLGLEQWREYAAEWIATLKTDKATTIDVMKIFLVDYIYGQKLATDPAEFLRVGYDAPCIYEKCMTHYQRQETIGRYHKKVNGFINYVLSKYFSESDITGEYRNPIPELPSKGVFTPQGRVRGSKDYALRYATDLGLEQWREYAAEWIAIVKVNKHFCIDVMKIFLVDYIYGQKLATDPAEFLRVGYDAPCIYEKCMMHLKYKENIINNHKKVKEFIDYVLSKYLTEPNVTCDYRNPIPDLPPLKGKANQQTAALDVGYVTGLGLDQWRAYATEWFATLTGDKTLSIKAIRIFLLEYIHGQKLATDPAEFLRVGYDAPCIYEKCMTHMKTATSYYNKINIFIDYVLLKYFSEIDASGIPVVSGEFHNPIPDLPSKGVFTPKGHVRGATDPKLVYATDLGLEQWRAYASEWIATLKVNNSAALFAMRTFLVDYIHGQKLATDPAEFLHVGYDAPCIYEKCMAHFETRRAIESYFQKINEFIAYVLLKHFSVLDAYGIPILSGEFRNPIPELPEAIDAHKSASTESNKNALPYKYLAELRRILCPKDAKHFSDWKWAQEAMQVVTAAGGDWYEVPESKIDKTDPDCVWRLREQSERLSEVFGAKAVFEMWCPARAVAVY